MGREIHVAYGFQTGHHYCGEQELKSYAICYQSSGHICYGLRKIMALQQLKLAYFKHLDMMNFCTFRFEKSLLELL